ncbi:MAG TPA: PLD nuclease N-terminal domain-containing protein [Chitinispirillaceae bacterium]|mgnify:CR=1 FL=1|jgi:hypothetical protein|nr:PLD nuclease N-terminal domain-containing protein [Chitinispirillaceae bacterium]
MKRKKHWHDFSLMQKKGIIFLTILQVILLASALIDIARRPSSEIKGRKLKWVLISFIDFAGPVSYFLFGRKSPEKPRKVT